MSLYILQGAVEEGFIYAFVALGLFVSYKILNIADLTTDGSFALGGVVAAVVANAGYPFLSLGAAVAAGVLAGLTTAFLQTRMKVPPILAGIITMTALYSINLMIMGGAPNLFFPGAKTVFTLAEGIFGAQYGRILLLFLVTVVVSLVLIFFFGTQLGLSIRATGDNRDMVSASSINPAFTITVGLCLSNGLIAFSGALFAQMNTQGDVTIGTGTVVIGLAGLILGDIAFRGNKVWAGVAGAVTGAVVYRLVLTFALRATSKVGYLKLVSALLVAVVISYPTVKDWVVEQIRRKKEAARYVEDDQG